MKKVIILTLICMLLLTLLGVVPQANKNTLAADQLNKVMIHSDDTYKITTQNIDISFLKNAQELAKEYAYLKVLAENYSKLSKKSIKFPPSYNPNLDSKNSE